MGSHQKRARTVSYTGTNTPVEIGALALSKEMSETTVDEAGTEH
jgi:hypothetical protein